MTDQRPLDLGIIRRLYGYTRRYARLRNTLSAIVVLRAIQLPFVTWALARVLSGPIAHRDAAGTLAGVARLPGGWRRSRSSASSTATASRCGSGRPSFTTCATTSMPTCCACR